MRHIGRCLAQQRLNGLVDVERNTQPAAPSLFRFGNLCRCAHIIDRAAGWRHMATVVRLASACGAVRGGRLPLVMSAEWLVAHYLPDTATSDGRPRGATKGSLRYVRAVWNMLTGGSDTSSESVAIKQTDSEEEVKLMTYWPEQLQHRWFWFELFCWLCCPSIVAAFIGGARVAMQRPFNWIGDLLLFLWFLAMMIFPFSAAGLRMLEDLEGPQCSMPWLTIGGKRFRVVPREEMCRWHPFWRDYDEFDPPIRCGQWLYPSCTSFIAYTLLDSLEVRQRMTHLYSISADHWKPLYLGDANHWEPLYLGDITGVAGEADILATFEAPQDFGRIKRFEVHPVRFSRKIVFLLGGSGGPIVLVIFVSSLSVNDGPSVNDGKVWRVDTSEEPVAGGRTLDERLPVTMARLKRFLWRYGGGVD
ncbi:unnamed protein product [Vitrella brassicaformis CCMP3155]|uniref:Uncharacterized protein n=1 Tax=Vitrella brassicaformis (strain CCMP3155) TaxID=1169540 RepID=A0A0G4GET3_VITBC|nr:unnamed protein product [Vitrella brassicaformis CCMP3155]|eukprot:CEM27688.1 unnamed protein product [Vitrella brassicaformis CCMP3155]